MRRLRERKNTEAFFDVPKFKGDTVVFTEPKNNAPTNSIVFDKMSGNVVEVNAK